MSLSPKVSLTIDKDYNLRAETEDDNIFQYRLPFAENEPRINLYRIINQANNVLHDIVESRRPESTPFLRPKYYKNLLADCQRQPIF